MGRSKSQLVFEALDRLAILFGHHRLDVVLIGSAAARIHRANVAVASLAHVSRSKRAAGRAKDALKG
jgi:hypothetical protein